MVQENHVLSTQSWMHSLSVRLLVQRKHTVCVDFGGVERQPDGASAPVGQVLIECFLKTDGAPLIQIFKSRVAPASPVAVSQMRIPITTTAPGTLFILCHGPARDMVQLWHKIEP